MTCPICKINHSGWIIYSRYLEKYDYQFEITFCPNCGIVYNPNPEAYHKVINDNYCQFTGTNWKSSGLYKQALQQRNFIRANWGATSTNIALDVGCGNGILLSILKEDFNRVRGYEPNKEARTVAKERTGSVIVDEPMESAKVKMRANDLITMSHVLEHVLDPVAFLERAKDLLADNGRIFIEVPDADHPRVMIPPFFVPEHTFNFNQSSLEMLFCRVGLVPVKIESVNSNPDGGMNYPVIRCLLRVVNNLAPLAFIPSDPKAIFDAYSVARISLIEELNDKINFAGFDQFWVFGTGYHTEILLEDMPELVDRIVGFLDNNPAKQKTMYKGKPVLAPDCLLVHECKNMLLSTIAEGEVLDGLKGKSYFNQLNIVRIYG